MLTEREPPYPTQAYRRLIEISRDLASTFDLDTLLRRIIRVATELSHAEEASILLYDDAKKELFFRATTNRVNERIISSIVVPKESIAGWVALHRQPVIVPDVEKDERWFGSVSKTLQFQTRSLIAVPLVAQDKLIGVLEVLNKREGTFNDQDQEILLVLGAQAAVAIENSRLFHQSDLIAELVHELRTPLSSINTMTYLMQRPNITQEQRLSFCQMIQSEAQRLNELTTAFLDLARLESGRMTFHITAFNLCELLIECSQIIEPKASENNIRLQTEMPKDEVLLEADRDKIKQAILNLLSNAVKYNRPNGFVNIRTWKDTGKVWVSVQDSGVGIPEDSLKHIFQRFYRVQTTEHVASGTGLGLSITKRIIDSHGGEITVKSKLGEGTTFTLYLPAQHKG